MVSPAVSGPQSSLSSHVVFGNRFRSGRGSGPLCSGNLRGARVLPAFVITLGVLASFLLALLWRTEILTAALRVGPVRVAGSYWDLG